MYVECYSKNNSPICLMNKNTLFRLVTYIRGLIKLFFCLIYLRLLILKSSILINQSNDKKIYIYLHHFHHWTLVNNLR